mmetsp:Transcript_5374/g.9658  ORF Transcript_5374/g.9658 Transcript_5374/m.9658 type:complete len:237 (-) Transcript_5374:639-1349(-)
MADSTSGSLRCFRNIGVSVKPGHTITQWIPEPKRSCVVARISPAKACLDVEYVNAPDTAFSDRVEPTKMMEDPLVIRGRSSLFSSAGATVCTLRALSIISGSTSPALSEKYSAALWIKDSAPPPSDPDTCSEIKLRSSSAREGIDLKSERSQGREVTSSKGQGDLEMLNTLAPISLNLRAVSRPIPELPPVTTATLTALASPPAPRTKTSVPCGSLFPSSPSSVDAVVRVVWVAAD